MHRRTKIVATLGPATDVPGVLERVLKAGVDVVRINFSHGKHAEHEQRIRRVREYTAQLGHEVGVLADLQGPKIRIACFKEGAVELQPQQTFVLNADLANDAGDQQQVGIDYKQLPHDVSANDLLLLDDGRIELIVENVQDKKIICRVKTGGMLSNNKGINRYGGGLSAPALTAKDREDLKAAVALDVDYIALSFVRNVADIEEARQLIQQNHSRGTGIIAKIERKEAIAAIDEIIKASDGVMVARGDLGVEIGYEALPAIQKMIIRHAQRLDKPVITATQMMESMIHNAIPTRAEVFDVANAVLDGTDAVMLSAETATGEHPDKVVEAMAKICCSTEVHVTEDSQDLTNRVFSRVDEAIAVAAVYTANHLKIKAIIALTESGSTPLWMSRICSNIPIYGLTRHVSAQRRMTLYRGVYPLAFDVTQHSRPEMKKCAVEELEKRHIVQQGDAVIITKGDIMGVHGGANALKIVTVGSVM